MPSDAALKQAGQDVLRYHTRRVYVGPGLSDTDTKICAIALAVGMVGVGLWKVAPIPGVILGLCFPVVQVFLTIRFLVVHGNDMTPENAAEASRKYSQAIHLLTHSTDVEAVGPLSDILWLTDITAYVPLALCRILLQLQTEHAALLSVKQRAGLMHVLTDPDPMNLELQRATVQAMAKIGDASALPVMEQLAGGAWGAAEFVELREDARMALLELQERINPGYVGRSLLRASDAPATLPDALLRPAAGSSEAPPQELLRAQNSP